MTGVQTCALPICELKDALEALAALGYKERDIKKVQKTLMKEEQMATDEYLRQALRLLN